MMKTKNNSNKSKEGKPKSLVAPIIEGTSFPIVGIGASAGGLKAFEEFFSGMPSDIEPNMAFVLVQHLAPNYKSMLTDLIQRFTRMKVFEVEDGMVVQKNCTYIIPPNYDMAFMNGSLHLLKPATARGQRLPIDFFFRSLAQDLHERAIGIVLSGSGSDGSFGIRAIKGEAGMVMAQEPSTCEFDGMPSSAIATGQVDYQLPPNKMPAQLITYVAHAFGKLSHEINLPAPNIDNQLKKIFILLRAQTGHDFSQYKPNTTNRRIERRMAVHQIETIDNYVKYLQQTPTEVEALFRDMLIGVTNFFRDPEAFKVLEEQIIPKLFAAKPAMGGVIRVWSVGCSTGEEAYSIAILLQERIEHLKQSYTVQVFATDIDSQAIATARTGIYSSGIAVDITPERLKRFFTIEPDGSSYRIHKGIRDMLVFSEQNLIKDPPFSKLDLISCRNLLIYLNPELQQKIIPLFHYALNPGGMLFLGSSEGVGEFEEMFTVLDRKSKLYQRKEFFYGIKRSALGQVMPLMIETDPVLPRFSSKRALPAKLPLRELTEQALLQQIAPAGALVNNQGDILYLHGRTGMYLEPAPGETSVSNILTMAREGLRASLTIALKKAVATNEIVRSNDLRVKTNGHFTQVNLSIRPIKINLQTPESPLYLVILEEAPPIEEKAIPPTGSGGAKSSNSNTDGRIAALEQELRNKEQELQNSHQDLQSSTEELKSSNEEMQSVNEELQSTNEELETSKEELQSVNEELATVNSELNVKVLDLSRINNDMNNLLAGSGIATIFVDHKLSILRFTPTAAQIINLIGTDVGRPVAHIVSNLVGYNSLVADAQAVLDTLLPKDLEVKTTAGMWFMMRIRPYRTVDNVIEGVVITFVDINERKKIEESLLIANRQLSLAVRDAFDAIIVQDLEGYIIAWNPGAVRAYGWSESEALQLNVRERIPQALREGALAKLVQLSKAEILEPYRTQRITKTGVVVDVWVVATALVNEAGNVYAVTTTERIIKDAKEV